MCTINGVQLNLLNGKKHMKKTSVKCIIIHRKIIHLDLQCSGYLRELIISSVHALMSKNKTPTKYSITMR